MKVYKYGMRLRGFSIGCQPMQNLYKHILDGSGKYWDIISYTEPLTLKEIADYELDFLGEETEKTHHAVRVNNLMYKGCEPHWKCANCGECIPFHCYSKQEFEKQKCKSEVQK